MFSAILNVTISSCKKGNTMSLKYCYLQKVCDINPSKNFACKIAEEADDI